MLCQPKIHPNVSEQIRQPFKTPVFFFFPLLPFHAEKKFTTQGGGAGAHLPEKDIGDALQRRILIQPGLVWW